MFTQCPECGSVFRVTADALKVAAGLVRCGVCQHRFDALAALTDDPGAPVIEDVASADAGTPADDGAAPPFDDTITVEELGSGEVIELGAANDDDVDADGERRPASDSDGLALGVVAPDADTRDAAAEWLPESGVPLATEDAERTESVDDAGSSDSIEVNDSSVTGLEAIILGGDESPMPEPPETAAVEEMAGDVARDLPTPTDEYAVAANAAPADDLEFHGSEADLERVFVATGAPVATTAPDDAATPAPDETPAAAAIEDLLPELLEVRDLPELAGEAVLDEAAESAAPHAAANAQAAPEVAPEARPDLDRTDEFPILVLDERDEAQADFGDADDRAIDDLDEARDEDEDARDDEERESSDHDEDILDTEDEEEPQEEPRVEQGPASSIASVAAAGTAGATAIGAALRHGARWRDGAAADDSPGPSLAIPEHLRPGRATEDADLRFGLDDETPRWWERRAIWVAGSIVLALALLGQAVHYNRASLSRNATLGPWVLRIYTLIGVPAPIPSDLDAIELRQWGAATDARAAGRLRLRASLVNRAPFAQPYPVLRVTLHDRFGNVLGSRDVGARDYLPGGAPQRRLLATGQRLDAEIVVVDPGADAVGYEIDLCEELRDGVRCQGTTRSPS